MDVVDESDPRLPEGGAALRPGRDRRYPPGSSTSQVNGGGGVLFNDAPSTEAIRAIGQAHRKFGTTGFLPTLISADLDVVARAIAAVQGADPGGSARGARDPYRRPLLNVARKGVHDPAKLRELDTSAVGLLTSLRGGKTLVTLAPEMTTPEIIEKLVKAGVVVSAGHTNATYAEIGTALAATTSPGSTRISSTRDVTTHGP